MKTKLVELAYKLMENNKADKLQIIYNGATIACMSPKEVYWGFPHLCIIKHVEYMGHREYRVIVDIDESEEI
ncbi:hypothetical protein QEJ66_gp16 [Clostridium phage CI461P1]|uniref:hypothetical protein n=1 Tax=Clostridium phage CI461P1 TaxID=2968680 RepID=UPI0024341A52|nr:hypothetical protein QEJ66_gp16 [Clostridium phage CI461P1]WAX11806.1 hypothetical protein CI461P1_00016 [Clostridium phage CI461P1]WAX11826.1 hypothetical protein CI461P2_00016 [Clostridium phage CI461P2]WAX11846.1 hypothetical protein CI461P3_00016 [Clostridium phage CI461P3]